MTDYFLYVILSLNATFRLESHSNSMKLSKPVIIAVAAVVLLAVGVAALLVFFPKNSDTVTKSTNSSANVKKLSPEDIGLNLTVRPDKKGIVMKITKLAGISSVEYDVSYDAKVNDEGQDAVVPRGVSGSPIQVKAGDSEISRDLDLGTCSKNVCKYDNVVSDVTFTIRVNYANGEIGGVETKISLGK